MNDGLKLAIDEVQRRWTPISAEVERRLFAQLSLGHDREKLAAGVELFALFDPIAFEEVWTNYASRIRRDGDKFGELVQEARSTIFEAIYSFDPGRGLLQPHIWLRMLTRQHLDRVLNRRHFLKVAARVAEQLRKLRAIRAEFEAEHGREPSRLYLVRELRTTFAEVDDLLLLDMTALSLDGLTKGGTAFSEFVLDESQDPLEDAEKNEQCLLVREVIEALPKDQQVVLQTQLDQPHIIRPEVLEPVLAAFKLAYSARIGIISA